MKPWVALGVALVVLIFAHVAYAQAGTDLVVLSNGGRVRGVVTDYQPGVQVVIQLADGTVRTYVAADVATVTFADGTASTTAPASGSATGTQPAASMPTVETVAEVPAAPAQTAESRTVEPEATRWSTARSFAPPPRPWTNAASTTTARLPHGPIHFGVQLEGSFMLSFYEWFRSGMLAGGGGGFAHLELTLGASGTLRFGVALSIATGSSGTYTFSDWPWSSSTDPHDFASANVVPSLRVMIGRDIGTSGFVRFGVDAGVALVPGAAAPQVLLRLELGGRLLPSQTLELGAALSLGMTSFARGDRTVSWEDSITYSGRWMPGFMMPRVDLFAGWVFE